MSFLTLAPVAFFDDCCRSRPRRVRAAKPRSRPRDEHVLPGFSTFLEVVSFRIGDGVEGCAGRRVDGAAGRHRRAR